MPNELPTPVTAGKRVPAGALVLLPTLCLAAADTAAAADVLMPRIVHETCSAYEKGKSFTILARFEDESQLFDPKVIYRSRGDTHWKHVAFNKPPRSETFRAVINSRELRGPLEYFIEVFDEYGNGPARIGRPDAPIRVVPARSPPDCLQVPVAAAAVNVTSGSGPTTIDQTVPPPPPSACDLADPPLYCSTWLWITVGTLVAAGATTATYFAVTGGGETDPASGTINITGANPTLTQ